MKKGTCSMKLNRARIVACLLVCVMGIACSACGRNSESSNGGNGEESSLSSEELAQMQKQAMTFQYALSDDEINSSDGNAGVPVNEGVDGQESNSNDTSSVETSVVVVTDAEGQIVTDAEGNTVTEVVTVGGNSSSSGNSGSGDESSNSNDSNGDSTGGGDGDSTSDYTPDMRNFQAYWLDMSYGEDVVCNGDFLDVTFRIKEDAPDGNYALLEGANDFANWDAEHVDVSFVAGDIAVGSAAQQETGTPESGTFTITAGTAKGNPGDEVTVRFDMSDNPGIVAMIFRFRYDANALEVVDAVVGEDCADYIEMAF